MQIEKVVSDASPFILFSKSGIFELFPKLFREILIPAAVWDEIDQYEDEARENLYVHQDILKRCIVEISTEVLVWNLGNGETEVLSYAFANRSAYTALIDDRAARRCADTLRINTMGTAGILILAKKRGLISSVQKELDKVTASGLWISDDVSQTILMEAGEI